MALSQSCAVQLAQNLTGQNATAPSQWCYVGLGILSSEVSGAFIEPNQSEYARVPVANTPVSGQSAMTSIMESYYDSTLAAGVATNSQIIFFNEALSDWGTLTHFALFDSEDSTTPYLYGELDSSVTIDEGYIPIFRASTLKVIMYAD